MLTAEGRKFKEALDARIAARVDAFKIEQRDLLEELAQVGIQIDMVNRLPNVATSDYRHAIPILMKHLRRDYSDGTLASLARSLATKEAQEYWDEFVSMYKKSPMRERSGVGDVAVALAAAVSAACPPDRLSDLVELSKDQTLPHRVLLLTPLKKRRGRDTRVAEIIEELRRDPALAKEINSWKVLPGQHVPHSH